MGFCSACIRWRADDPQPHHLSLSLQSQSPLLSLRRVDHTPMPGSSRSLREFLASLVYDEYPAPSFTLAAAGNFNYSQPFTPRSCHSILDFIVPALLGLLDLMYKDGTSPFATHPKTMRFAVVCLLAYCWVYGAEQSVSSSFGSRALMRGMMLLGSLSLASLGSIFVPDSLQWVVYMLYTLMWMGKWVPRLSGLVEALVSSRWERCRRRAFLFSAPSLWRHTSRSRGSILPL